MNSLVHISLTYFLYESRILKEVKSIDSINIFNSIYIIALHRDNLKTVERIEGGILIRLPLKSKGSKFNFKTLIFLELVFRIFYILGRIKLSVVSIHVIDLLPIAFLIKIFKRKKIIYDAHELETHTSNNKLKILFLSLIEFLFIKYVDLIIVVNRSIELFYKAKYPKIPVVSVYNAPNYLIPKYSNVIREELALTSDKTIFLYQGGLEEGRGIRLLLKAFSEISDKNNVIVFMGYGSLKVDIIQFSLNNENIYMLDAVKPQNLLSYTESCDYGLCLIENSCLSYYYSLPNKLLEYLMARKPVIVSNLPEMKSLVFDHSVGVVVEELSSQNILEAIRKILSMDKNHLIFNIEKNIDLYSWENQEVVLHRAYEEILN
jgi:glycosyltransferase involved in cell wall biosynthesis